jgi:hypothetical protein
MRPPPKYTMPKDTHQRTQAQTHPQQPPPLGAVVAPAAGAGAGAGAVAAGLMFSGLCVGWGVEPEEE